MLAEAGLSDGATATALRRLATENGTTNLTAVSRSHISYWARGTVPSDPRIPLLLAELLSRALGRTVTVFDLAMDQRSKTAAADLWTGDTLSALIDIGRRDLSMDRRHALSVMAFQTAALTLPTPAWWRAAAVKTGDRPSTGRRVGRGDVEAVQDTITAFSQIDQRRGGGHARTAVVQYLTSEVEPLLHGRFATDALRRQMFSAAGELTYLSGWMSFDAGEHPLAQQYLTSAVRLAAEAGDEPLAGHILRAMAHQANDLGHHRAAQRVAAASLDGDRSRRASYRERALLRVVHARTLATTGDARKAVATLKEAEDDLTRAAGQEEPQRVWFFTEASLAHETACTLRDLGDLDGAVSEFRRSARTRGAAFPRTHAVTLGYLGEIQARQGNIEQACVTWSRALDLMEGIRSGRTIQTARQTRSALSPYRLRGVRAVHELDARAASYLEYAS
ncbi:Tat pathway signal protein [Streptacidiphilus sp. NEAU-YB345]|uniref:Tat pathway signal protein n=1 Tax=Streptacidiphilus fuscans TaxID=2789292 RepID=A0A931B840_9ACTN|nr:Tat pathway signal protein [Streptacidiphilus fuscans]